MSCKHFVAALLIGLVVAAPAWAFLPTSLSDYEVHLPAAQVSPAISSPDQATMAQLLPALSGFQTGEGAGWGVIQWNQTLGRPATMAGPAIPVVASNPSEESVRSGIEAFVARNASVLGIHPQDMRVTDITQVTGERTSVFMTQYYNGLEVIDGRLDFSLWKGAIVLIGTQVYQGINVNTLATIDENTAIAQAHRGIPESAADAPTKPARLVILPILSDAAPVYHLAWEIYLKTKDPEDIWRTYVDAHDGSVLWREGQYQFYTINGSVHGQVEMVSVYIPRRYTDAGLEYDRVTASGSYSAYTDPTGVYSITVPNNTNYSINAQLFGQYCNVNRADGSPDATITQSGNPSAPVNFMFDDTNSHAAERDAYYHVNETHDWLKVVDPSQTHLDGSTTANVNINNSCNAYWNGSAVNFYLEGGGCNNTGRIADVISHEYGHGITQWEYYPQGAPTGSGMGEGFSDIYAMTIHGDPIMGENFNTNGTPVRNGENLRQYPGSDCAGEVHCLGEIIMGAMWKTRKNFVQKYGDSALYDHLLIQTVKNKTTSQPSFLTHLLTNDDTDGNLQNGSPDWAEICDAFAIHNLPCPPLTNYVTVTSDAIDDQAGAGGYTVTAIATAVGGGAIDPSAVKIFYTTDPVGPPPTWLTADMAPTGQQDQYRGQIPHQDCGKHVRYYVRAAKATGEYATAPSQAPYRSVYEFMTGQFTAFADDLEQDRGWTVHPPEDTATAGWFQRADPIGKHSTTYGYTQPDSDHTATGVKCFVTDSTGGVWSANDVDNGTTSVVSPRFAWRGHDIGEVRFWSFYFDLTPNDDSLRCAISTDDGHTWTDIFKLWGQNFNDWNFYKVYLENSRYQFSDSTRFRFQMEDLNVQTTCAEAAIDDIDIRSSACVSSDVAGETAIPARFFVEQNRPNPFNPVTTIKFGLPKASHVSIEIFDAGGRKVRTLVNDQSDAGFHSAVWDGRNDAHHAVGSGVYYYTVKAGDKQAGNKMILLK